MRRALFTSYRGICPTYQSDACFHLPPFWVAGVKQHWRSLKTLCFCHTPLSPHKANHSNTCHDAYQTSALSLQDLCHMRARPYHDFVVEYSFFSKFSDSTSRSHFSSKWYPAYLFVPGLRPYRRPWNRSLYPRKSSFKVTTTRYARPEGQQW